MLHDVFLSHHSADKPAVEELARRLLARRLKPWLDSWHLVPGDPWQPALEEALTNSSTCAVFIGPSGISPWQNAEMRVAISRQVSERRGKYRVIPVLLPGAERGNRSKLPSFLTANTWVEFRRTLDDASAFERLLWGITGKAIVDPVPALAGRCPYKGLRYFEVEDAPFFHGRDALTEWLVDKLQPRPAGPEPTRFLAIMGASGSGKSSLARAGLMAKVKEGAIEGSRDWLRLILRPGQNPLESLALALCKALKPGADAETAAKLIQSLQKEDATLHREAGIALHGTPEDRRLLVLVDQFEEVFTLCDQEELRRAFIANLLHAATVAQGRVWVVMAMRADFYGKCATYPGLATAVSELQFLVGPMSADELRVAVERPARLVGDEVEPALVERLVQQLTDEPGALPLLQDTLQELWNKPGRGRAITQDDYEGVGGLGGALEKRANAVLQSLSDPERELCRQIFLRLVQPGEGTGDTKRRARLHELSCPGPDVGHATYIIEKLVQARLLSSDGDRDAAGKLQLDAFIEVAHEALIRSWSELRKWVDAGRAGLRTHRRLGEAAKEWEANRRDPSYLDTGGRLAVAQEWAERHATELNGSEAEFLKAGIERRDRDRKREEVQKQRLRMSAIAAVVLAMLSVAGAIVAWNQRHNAKDAERAALRNERESHRQLAEVSWGLADSFRDSTAAATESSPIAATHYLLQAALASYHAGDISGVRSAALAAGSTGARLKYTLAHDEAVAGSTNSPDGRRILTWSFDGTARLWEVANGAPASGLMRQQGPIRDALFSPDGRRILGWSGGFDQVNELKLWDSFSHQQVGQTIRHGRKVQGAFSPNGQQLLSWGEDGTARLWEASTGTARSGPLGHGGPVWGAEFSTDGRRILTWSEDGTVRLWDAINGSPLGAPRQHDSPVWGAKFARDGHRILSWSTNCTARLWDATDPSAAVLVMRHKDYIWGAQFCPDERQILTWSADRTTQLWDSSNGEPLGPPMPCGIAMSRPVLSRDGRQLLTWADSTVWLWNLAKMQPGIQPITNHASVLGAEFAPDSQRILIWCEDGVAQMHSAIDGAPLGRTMEQKPTFAGAAFGGAGQQILTWTWDHFAQLWNAADGTREGQPMEHHDSIRGARFADDGLVQTWSDDGTLRMWKPDVGSAVGSPIEGLRVNRDAIFSADGRRVLTLHTNGAAKLWNTFDGNAVGSPLRCGQWIVDAAFSPGCSRLLTWSEDGKVQLWDVENGSATGPAWSAHQGTINGAAFSGDEKRILTWAFDGTAQVWDAMNWARVGKQMKHQKAVWGAQFSPDQRRVLTWSEDCTARLWDAASGAAASTWMKHSRPVQGGKFIADGRRIFTWSGGLFRFDQARFWDATNGAAVGKPIEVEEPMVRIQVSSQDDRILTWNEGDFAQLWDSRGARMGEPMVQSIEAFGNLAGTDSSFAADGQKLLTWFAPGVVQVCNAANGVAGGPQLKHPGVTGASFSADGQWVLTWSKDGTVRLWDATNGVPIGRPMKHQAEVWEGRFSADGRSILTWSSDRTARLWSAGNSRCIAEFRHRDAVSSAHFNRDETRVLTTSMDGTARLWNVAFDETLTPGERILEFEVRSATRLDGQVKVLSVQEWEQRKQKLLEAEIQTGKAITASGTPHRLTKDELAAKRRELAGLKSHLAPTK